MARVRTRGVLGVGALLGAAALAAGLSGCTVVTRHAPKPTPELSSLFGVTATPLGPGTGSPAPSGDADAVEPCRAAQLAASVDAGRSGEASGVARLVIALRNTGATACLLGGVPGLTGDGVSLPVFAAPDRPYAAGALEPGAVGFVRLDEQLSGCSRPLVRHATLGLVLGPGTGGGADADGGAGAEPGPAAVTLPWPAALNRSGCLDAVTAAGLG